MGSKKRSREAARKSLFSGGSLKRSVGLDVEMGGGRTERLPVRDSFGRLQRVFEDAYEASVEGHASTSLVHPEAKKTRKVEEVSQEDEAKAKDNDEKGELNRCDDDLISLNAAGIELRRSERKLELALLAEEILQNPEKGLDAIRTGGSCMNHLQEIALRDPDKSVQGLAILSIVAVFRDILPDYRIRAEEDIESKKLKKEIRATRRHEDNMLDSYQRFLTLLHSIAKDSVVDDKFLAVARKKWTDKPLPADLNLALITVRAQCTLLVAKPTFNFRENLLTNIVPQMSSPYAEVRSQACSCISTLLKEDKSGDATLEIVVYISKFIRARENGRRGRISPDMVDVLRHCKISADMKDSHTLRKADEKKKKIRASRKERDEVMLNLLKSEAEADHLHRFAKNVEALREVFTMYLRCLKAAPLSPIIPAVLRGVTKFVHLINLEIAQALVTTLTTMMEYERLPIETSFQIVISMSLTLRGPGVELKVDEAELVAFFYRLLLRMQTSVAHGERDQYVLLVVKCAESIFLRRKVFQHSRVAGVAVRISILAATVSPHACLALLSLLSKLIQRYASACRELFESESVQNEGSNPIALGVLPSPLDAKNIDPKMVHKDAQGFWSLSQLCFHYHPKVRSCAKQILNKRPLVANEEPEKLFDKFDPYLGGNFRFVPRIEQVHIINKKKKKK